MASLAPGILSPTPKFITLGTLKGLVTVTTHDFKLQVENSDALLVFDLLSYLWKRVARTLKATLKKANNLLELGLLSA